jgi:transposase
MRVLVARFFRHVTSENVQVFWAALQRGGFITDAAEAVGRYRKQGTRWVAVNGGVRPRRGRTLQGRYLCFGEREEIALGRAGGESMRSIAKRLGRSPSTICRELSRNRENGGRYRATTAHALSYDRASRPKPAKLARNLALRTAACWSTSVDRWRVRMGIAHRDRAWRDGPSVAPLAAAQMIRARQAVPPVNVDRTCPPCGRLEAEVRVTVRLVGHDEGINTA